MKSSNKLWGLVLSLLLFVMLPFLGACGDDKEEKPTLDPTSSPGPVEDVVITIGNLSDLTGPSASAQNLINLALDDLVDYFNEENLIPGVELEVITYDGQFDPSKDIPGYEWLKERGADLIWTGVPGTPVTLQSRVDKDQVPLFAASIDLDEVVPSGYVFGPSTPPRHEALTLIKWIAENDWDYESKGPAKIGGAGWDEVYTKEFFDAMKDYAEAHPEQFEYVGGYLTNFSFIWGPEVEALKDCDYVFPSTVLVSFVKEYRNAGYDAKFIGTFTHAAFFGPMSDAKLWDEIDGMLFLGSTQWWNEEGTLIDLTKRLLYENHPDNAEEIIRGGVGYKAMGNLYQVLDIIKKAAETVGPENLDSQAIYDAAESYTLTVDGIPRFSFSSTKRYSTDYYTVYEAGGAEEDIFRIEPEWLPAVMEP
ncbi:MAG: ABC transporter substrate-binding protein [Chloroflexi bacterium]|nr:ABC transporter substrate-binding protein [Chloroflexota bacterium]